MASISQSLLSIHFDILFQDFADDETIYIDIGTNNNTETTVGRGSGNPTTTVSTNGILDCTLPISFWMSWEGDEVQVSTRTL